MKISVFYEHIAEAAKQSGKSLAQICGIVRSYGITCIEIEDARLQDREDEIRKLLIESDLTVNCIYAFCDFGNNSKDPKIHSVVDMAKRMGADKILIIPGFVREEELLAQNTTLEELKVIKNNALLNMVQALQKTVEYATEQGITVGMEDFDDKIAPFATAEQLLWFMQKVTGLTCAFDTGNFLYSEEDATEALRILKPYIRHVHCKDRSFLKKEGEVPKLIVKNRELYSSPVGSGCIPMKEILTTIMQMGYKGSFAIEHFGSLNQLEDMGQSAAWLLEFEKKYK
ncbi:MAG: sugar phosphate isomerase/epimerase family protein [Mobilitalea sp.]